MNDPIVDRSAGSAPRRRSIANGLLVGLLPLLLISCPGWQLGCALAVTHIKNDTDTAVEVELTWDDLSPYEIEEQFRSYSKNSAGVELVRADAARRAATYRIAPSAMLIVPHQGLALGFSRVAVTKAGETKTFSEESDVIQLFEWVESNTWEFDISSAF